MSAFFPAITDQFRAFIEAQKLFFVATAAAAGRINLSPKGMDGLRVLDPKTVAYLDFTGSASETSAHLLADGRITVMLCSFDEKPLILRLHGRGQPVRPTDARWDELCRLFPLGEHVGTRQIMLITVDDVETSCGWGVPRFDFVAEREMLTAWAEKKGAEGIADYQREKNALSMDGLPTGVV